MSATRWLGRFREAGVHGALGAYVLRQRWFTPRGSDLLGLAAVEAVPLLETPEHSVVVLLVAAMRRDGTLDEYVVPLAIRPATTARHGEGGDSLRVGVLVLDGLANGAEMAVDDALADPESADLFWSLCRQGAVREGVLGVLRFADNGLPADPDGPPNVRPLGREQSNSSVIRHDTALLKVIRRAVRGTNPELEMTAGLAARGFDGVAGPLAVVEHVPYSGDAALVAIIQPYLHNGSDGWALALTSLRVHYADAEEASPDAVMDVATFSVEAARLGATIGAMHVALLQPDAGDGLRSEPLEAAQLAAWATDITAGIDSLLDRPDPEGRLVALRAHRDDLVGTVDAIRRVTHGGTAIRVHGDLHLGQLLRTDSGWVVLDFEGEPDRPLEERRRPAPALVDVAGLRRSFDYAAAVALAERDGGGDEAVRLAPVGARWARGCREAFLRSYVEATAGTDLLPGPSATTALLSALEIRKAVYELGYELDHRPDWAAVPLRFLLEAGRRVGAGAA